MAAQMDQQMALYSVAHWVGSMALRWADRTDQMTDQMTAEQTAQWMAAQKAAHSAELWDAQRAL